MELLIVVLLVFGFVLFVLAAPPWLAGARFNLVAAGLACWILTVLIERWPG